MHEKAPSADRAVVTDDGRRITLAIYGAAGDPPLAAVGLPPLQALALAERLIAAALAHLRRAPMQDRAYDRSWRMSVKTPRSGCFGD